MRLFGWVYTYVIPIRGNVGRRLDHVAGHIVEQDVQPVQALDFRHILQVADVVAFQENNHVHLRNYLFEQAKLYNPDLSNAEIAQIQYKVYELRATQALQISPLLVSYSHADSKFVDKVGNALTEKGIRYWRDIHEMKSGRIEKQIDRAIRQNPTVLLVLSEHSVTSDWVEHELRTARELEKELKRDVLCPLALDDSWKSSRWPKRIMEQIMEYNILDFSHWQDESKFDGMFRRLIDGLELFYKG